MLRETAPGVKHHKWHLLLGLLSSILLSVGAVVITAEASPEHHSAPAELGKAISPEVATGCGWELLSSPNVDQYNALNAVAPLAPNDVWAVGSRGPGFTGQFTLIEHWDGN